MIRELIRRSPAVLAAARLIRTPRACFRLLGSEGFPFVTHFPPGHFYSPIPDRSYRVRSVDRAGEEPEPFPGISLGIEAQKQLCAEFAPPAGEIPFLDEPKDGLRYRFDNSFFRHGDATILYCMLRHFKPQRIIEVGSGFSSALMMDVNDLYLDGRARITFIEPFPERLEGLMRDADRERYEVKRAFVQDVPVGFFGNLQENDVLFIDSSHVVKTGSDVLHLLTEVFPRLAPGVLVHVHDVFWPFEYPVPWIRSGRAWNEAYFVHAFLLHNPSFRIEFWNSALIARCPEVVGSCLPGSLVEAADPLSASNSSLWLRKVRS